MGILNLNDVPPPLNVNDADNETSAVGKEPTAKVPTAPIATTGAPAKPGTSTSSMFDTSALTDESTTEPATPTAEPATPIEVDEAKTLELKPKIVDQLVTVFDPEIPVNIYELGLIYDIEVDASGCRYSNDPDRARCPAAITLPAEVQGKVKSVDGSVMPG
ncbi:MAG: hypothetical protein Ct9H300mP25_00650 [Acidobacteriota bacterium]|nr:MAG: hypothetical protein Ct9H300mP25_00650 [Acidobacteriota bacterium]